MHSRSYLGRPVSERVQRAQATSHTNSCWGISVLPLPWCPAVPLGHRLHLLFTHLQLLCFHQSDGNCSPCSCDPVYHPLTTTPAEEVTQVCQHDRHEEEWQKDKTRGGSFCQERNYCKATRLAICRMGVGQKISQPGLARSHERKGGEEKMCPNSITTCWRNCKDRHRGWMQPTSTEPSRRQRG